MTLTKEQKLEEELKVETRKIKTALCEKNIKHRGVAESAVVSEQAVSNQFSRGKLTMLVYLAAQILLGNR
jgi:hypothetical protein